jgi:hypothetical protein
MAEGLVISSPWYWVYDIIEWLANRYVVARPEVNSVLTRFGSGYRFVGSSLAPITNEHELAAIEHAVAAAEPFPGAVAHLQAAVAKLAEKPEPDYRNSIKESISAVESVVKTVSGKRAAGIKEPLAALQEVLGLHGGFAAGIKALYGWTSDADGIRHAILEEPTVSHADAKFMLVTCSALVNFVIDKAGALGKPS